MSAATLVRRRQMILEGGEDCFQDHLDFVGVRGRVDSGGEGEERILIERREQSRRDQSLLRLMNVLQSALAGSNQVTLLSLLSSRPRLLENLR